jgi:hypothetical protein
LPASEPRDDDDEPLGLKQYAASLGISVMSLWRGVRSKRITPPFYPAPRKPMWTKGDARADRERLRNLPSQVKTEMRAAKLRIDAVG